MMITIYRGYNYIVRPHIFQHFVKIIIYRNLSAILCKLTGPYRIYIIDSFYGSIIFIFFCQNALSKHVVTSHACACYNIFFHFNLDSGASAPFNNNGNFVFQHKLPVKKLAFQPTFPFIFLKVVPIFLPSSTIHIFHPGQKI